MYSTKLLNFSICINIVLIVVFNLSSIATHENDTDHLCITFERKTMNVSKTIPQTVEQEILSICEHNGTYHPCQKRVNNTQMKTIWVEEDSIVPVKICCMGYKKVDGVCIPICSTACENAVCVSPDKCKCNDGFIRDKKDAHKCNPVCNGCEDGLCLFPNLCECDDGYRWEASELKCIPICTTDCLNGECVAPNNCSCNENYYFNETLHSCEPNCQNGYRFQANSSDVCEPICEPNCHNAQCVAPNECECNDTSYEKSNISNATTHICCPICGSAEDCRNGKCGTSDSICNCTEWFRLHQQDNNYHVLPNEPLATTIPNHSQSNFNWHILWISTIIVIVIIVIASIIVWLYRNQKTNYYLNEDDSNHVVRYSAHC